MHELGYHSKLLSLKQLFKSIHPFIILIQETMAYSHKIFSYFSKILLDWNMVVVDSTGHSGGLAALWDPDGPPLMLKFFLLVYL